jgi:pimeloyl-ACP methyl ester carboxylesterase
VVERWERQPVFATQSPELVAAQRPGRLSHDPAELARLLRTAGQGAMPPVWDRLPELELPVLCMAGALDETYVAAARRMASLLPGGTMRTVPGAGHAPQLEKPDAVAAELRAFLDERL